MICVEALGSGVEGSGFRLRLQGLGLGVWSRV